MRNEQALADAQHRVRQVVRAHDQLGRCLGFVRDLRQDVAASHDVLLFLRRPILGEEHLDVHLPQKVFRFFDVRAAREFLEKIQERVAGFDEFPFLAQFRGGLEIREGHIRHRLDGNLAAFLLLDFALGLNKQVVAKKRRPAEDHDRE